MSINYQHYSKKVTEDFMHESRLKKPAITLIFHLIIIIIIIIGSTTKNVIKVLNDFVYHIWWWFSTNSYSDVNFS